MSIDSLYEGVIAKLTERGKILEISKKLLLMTNNEDRTLFVYGLIEELKAFPKLLEVNKTKSVSAYYRNLGNDYFKKNDDYRAWQYYNLSLLHAPANRDEMAALAISNRSAVFYSMGKYREALDDIFKVFSMKYPVRLKDKLLKRKAECEEEIKDEVVNFKDGKDFEWTVKTRDPTYLCASDKLKVEFSEEMGRHVVAKQDIKVGEVLVFEEPYLILLLKSQILFSCSYCLSRKLNLMPCDKCCFALYCSEICKEKAWKEYHETECQLMATLIHLEFTKLELLALRTVVKARTDHDNWDSLFQTIKNADANENNEYKGCIKVDGKWVFDSKHYATIHTLASNIEKRGISDIFQKSVTAAVLLRLLEIGTDLLKCDNENEREKIRRCVAGLLLHHDMTCPTNMHGISSNMENGLGQCVDEVSIASAPYGFHSLVNHSCSPNVVRFNKLGVGEMSLIALRPIKKGMQIFDNYGAHHALESRSSRQSSLKFQYKFTCMCEACENNWPTYFNLRPGNLPHSLYYTKQTLLDEENNRLLKAGDVETAKDLFKPLCELAEALEPYAPCVELADTQEFLKQCLHILGGLVPYGYSKLVEWTAIPPKV